MTDVPIRRALISVSDKADLIPFARELVALGVTEIVSTGGTARVLTEAGIDVVAIDAVTGVPEMMDGRVKTLHPRVHGGLLARRDDDSHVASMNEHDIRGIDLVCINLYPFEQTIARSGVAAEEAIEQIDIGGPAMLRSAAKNHEWVTVVTSPQQYDSVVSELRANDGASTFETRRRLAAAAFTRTAAYDTAISKWMNETDSGEHFPSQLGLHFSHVRTLRYGENPHQSAAVYADPALAEPGVVTAEVLSGKPLSYNNLADAAAAVRIVQDLHQSIAATQGGAAAAAVIKHTNPCGAAVGANGGEAFRHAYAGDPRAAYGGILALSCDVDQDVTDELISGRKFLEVVIAPGYADGCAEQLSARWKNVRLLRLPGIRSPRTHALDYRSVPGGLLVQDRDTRLSNPGEWRHVAGPSPDESQVRAAVVAWTAVKHLSSNAIAIANSRMLLGAGSGQVDRVTACRLAVEKASEDMTDDAHARLRAGTSPLAAASDAFFPFADGPMTLIDGGVSILIQPGGSMRDEDTNAVCNERGVTCMHTGIRHFRH